ncbi:LuxR C-terminal-related transcriptional regulator [Streptomyces sp. NBC_01190]|uniref:helix-turn-helix transcriptional regulator n=1 Tax=Streptomyces sp. NBC_01190 TaxID=2903767 RepID=UPI00386C4686|nr:helix-turn-helix transcriptional regulator [Streptomyces sp. NBC_01190]
MSNSVRAGGPDAAQIGLALYQTLRTNGSSSPSLAASGLGLTESEAEVGWSELRALGLIRPGAASEEVDSVEPDTALIGLLARQRDALRAQRDELTSIVQAAESLIERYRPAVLRESADIEVELVRGDSRKRGLLSDFNARIAVSTGSMHPGPLPPAEILAQSLKIDGEMVARGIKMRAIYGQSIDSAPRQRKYLSELTELGVEVRLAPQVPFDLIIADSHSALLAANPEDPAYALIVVRGAALVRSYVALYEDCWLRAAPHAAKSVSAFGPGSELTEQHRTTMRLLANGLTDERIARKLGVSLRTVSRLVSEIMRYLQADSRFQAGVLAAAHGLI